MPRLTAIVLGSAAGGGVPQWNCSCAVCRLAWAGDPRVKSRTQTSLAVSGNGKDWILLNASPDMRLQIANTRRLQPRPKKISARRSSPISAVVLTGAEIDQVGGLLHMREGHAFTVVATKKTLHSLKANPIFNALSQKLVSRQPVLAGKPIKLPEKLKQSSSTCPGKCRFISKMEIGRLLKKVKTIWAWKFEQMARGSYSYLARQV